MHNIILCWSKSINNQFILYIKGRITKPSTRLHPAPSTSTQLISASTQLSATSSTLLEPKYHTPLGDFPKFRLKNSKLSILTENWHTGYPEGADSKPRLRFLKFRPQNPFLRKFRLKKSKLFVLPKNWHTWYLEDPDSYSNVSFLNFQL